jgi:hypothetical protein
MSGPLTDILAGIAGLAVVRNGVEETAKGADTDGSGEPDNTDE